MTQGPQTPPTPPTPDELWEELVQEAGEDEIETACAESDEEVEAYLAANGFDVEAERAKGEAFLAALTGETGRMGAAVEAGEAPESERDVVWEAPRRRPTYVERAYPAAGWIATAATVALGAAAATSVLLATPAQPGHDESDAHTDQADDVIEMRATAEQRMQVGPKPKG